MTNDSISNKLSELFDLFKSGALTQEEYDQLKSEIVNQGGKQPVKEKVQKEEPVKEAIRKIVIEQPIIEKVQEKEPVKVLKKEIVIFQLAYSVMTSLIGIKFFKFYNTIQ